jgi:ketosteroid isomerase-like protein
MSTREDVDDTDEIRHRIEHLVEAIRGMDLDGLRACFGSDIVSFDVGPRQQDVGVEAKLSNWQQAFAALQPPITYEIRDLAVTVGKDVAFAHGINRLGGTLNGSPFGPWVRWTAGLRKIDGCWLIVHDQVSVPVDPTSGRAVLDFAAGGTESA